MHVPTVRLSFIDGICPNCTYGDGNPIYFSTPYSFNESPSFSYHPTHSQPILCEFCGNDARYGHYCTPQVPIISNPESCYNQNYDEFPQNLPIFQQQILCCENCEGPHATFECQPMNQNFHDSNSSSYDQFQPSEFPVIHQPPKEIRMEALQAREDLMESIQNVLEKFNRICFRETPKILMQAWDKFFEVKHAQSEEVQELLNKLLQDLKSISEELAEYINLPSWNRPAYYYEDDDEEYTIAITPDLPTEEPDNSLSMGEEHLSTIPVTESDEVIKSSVENLVPIPSESEDFSDIETKCDMPDCDDSQMTNFSTFSNPLFDDSTSSDDESSHEEVIHEMSFKTYSNLLFDLDEEIIYSEFNPIHNEDLDSTPKNDCFNTESYLLESLLNCDTLMVSFPKIDSLFEGFTGELKTIPLGVANIEHEECISMMERLLYDNSTPRPPEAFQANYDTIIESFSPSPILVKDS
ncbi:hypothetical protein Tco_1461839, partial [Tanacetum coccineum]